LKRGVGMKAAIIAILGTIAVMLMIAGAVINAQHINKLEHDLAIANSSLQCYVRNFNDCKEQLGVFYMPPKGGEVSDNRTNKAAIK
jgi:hypothetical protein